jgi:hypothetical protein
LYHGGKICLDTAHPVNLPEIYNHQKNQPAGDVKPWSLIKRDIVHDPEFYNKNS